MNATIDFDRYDHVRPIRWTGETLALLDQCKLPFAVEYVACRGSDEVAEAIHALTVRGAPAIGIAAAWGVVLGTRAIDAADGAEAARKLEPAMQRLNAARPTAVNLAWALARMRRVLGEAGPDWRDVIEREARAIETEDLAANRHMGALGACLIAPGSGVLTHCNTGSLATAGFGTALGVIRAGVAAGRIERVFAGETRPWNQGARLTVWELQQDAIDATLIADAAASHLMKTGQVQWVVVGADRICANGDTANKIGTYAVAVLAREHGLPFLVAAPRSTIDRAITDGSAIPIEERSPREVTHLGDQPIAPVGVAVQNPAFDVTPARLVTAIITEAGVARPPFGPALAALFPPAAAAGDADDDHR